jgi:hypothetical protein
MPFKSFLYRGFFVLTADKSLDFSLELRNDLIFFLNLSTQLLNLSLEFLDPNKSLLMCFHGIFLLLDNVLFLLELLR